MQRIITGITLMVAMCLSAAALASPIPPSSDSIIALAQHDEQRTGSRIGLFISDTSNNHTVAYRADERFPMASTFKLIMCGDLLKHADNGRLSLSQEIKINAGDIVAHSPITQPHVGSQMRLDKLCMAALDYSDNTAANSVLKTLGGPAEITRYARETGDNISRLDRFETSLNEALPNDPRDTTSPQAMSMTMTHLLLGNALSKEHRNLLIKWMRQDKVADDLLRAVIPESWKIADKSGAGLHGTRNIIAVVWPPHHMPITIAIYITGSREDMAHNDALIRALGREIVARISDGL